MQDLPIHPALVHLPIGVAVLLPLLSLGIAISLWRESLPKRAWLVVLMTSILCLAGAMAARQTGEREEARVEEWVSRHNIHIHEEAADSFIQALTLTTVACAALFLIRNPRSFQVATIFVTLGYVGVLALALNVGHLGGELVFRHNAGAGRAPAD